MLIPSDEIQNGQNGGFRGLGDVQSIWSCGYGIEKNKLINHIHSPKFNMV
jgi:hypothetical protein